MGNLLDPTESQVAHLEGRKNRRAKDRRRSTDEIGLLEKIREWCRGKDANARLPLGVWFTLLFLLYFYNQDMAANIDLLNAVLHKLGHFVWAMIVPDTPIAGGWLMQFGVPMILMFYFYRHFDYFGIAITFAWIGTVLLWNAPYALRAPASEFPPSILRMEEPIHDWNEMLNYYDIMGDSAAIAASMRWGGLLALAFGIYFLASQLYFMYTLQERRKETERRMAAIATGK